MFKGNISIDYIEAIVMKLLIYLSLLFKLSVLEDIILEKPDGEKILVNNIDNNFSVSALLKSSILRKKGFINVKDKD